VNSLALLRRGITGYIAVTSLAFLLELPSTAMAQTNYLAFELVQENNFRRLNTEDLNGDGTLDLIVQHFQEDIGRELHVYHQQADGTFSQTPQRIEIKTEIIAVGFADIRSEPGKELLLFASNGVFSLSTASDGYAGNIRQLFEWDLIATVPNLESVQFFNDIKDVNGDGYIDLLLPGEKLYGFFRGLPNEEFTLVTRLTTTNENLAPAERPGRRGGLDANMRINADEGLVLEVTAQESSPFAGFIEEWVEDENSNSLLDAESWIPSAQLVNLNDDGLPDIAYLNVGDDSLGQLNIHYQSAAGEFTDNPDWQGRLETRGDIRLIDLNGDEQLDLLRIDGNGNEWTCYFFINSSGKFNLEQADQVMRFSGYDVELNFIDINGDGRPSLNVGYYTIPVVNAIRNASIVRTQLLYSGSNDESSLFSRRPDSRLEESFSADEVRGLAEQMSLRFDIDGDGIKDAMYITAEGTLAAKRIDEQLQIASEPFWQYVPDRGIVGFNVLHLNSDNKPDLILRHNSATTVLVATP
jgi:hypothetical protein|tara:strand:- start:1489 stop:3063 length:1575 start_codon:yes stop_codon:yes gene_type:complete